MATRVTSAGFVGRATELEELEAALRDAGDSKPSLAFVAGESGVGKTRLASELAARARDQGARVLSGDCIELGEGELPYAPLLGALRPLVREDDPALAELSPALRDDLATLLPGLAEGPPDVAAPQSRVFEALLQLLDTLGSDNPVLLVIEDLHWADSSTRHFVRFLSRMVCRERLLVLSTYRSDELHRRHPLRPLLAEVGRDPTTRIVELKPFTPRELALQLEDILGRAPEPDLISRLHGRSEGNPLFAEELLAAGPDGRGPLPPTLRDALMLRVERLSPDAQELLRWLACHPADQELLAEVSGLPAQELRDGLREVLASQIAVTMQDGSYEFRHALLREVVYEDLLPGERSEHHAVLAKALERRLTDDSGAHLTAQIAHHWTAAGDQPAAFGASLRAARAAERLHAFSEAASLLERVLGLWDRVPDAETLAGADRVDLLARAAYAASMGGDSTRQEALLRRALELVDEASEPRRAAALLERLHRAQWNLNRQDESVGTIEHALALLEPGEQSAERAALLAGKARARMLQGRHREAVEGAREALVVARAVGDHPDEVRALNALGVSQALLGDVDSGTAALRDALAILREHGLVENVTASYVNLADTLHLAGRTDEGIAIVREALEHAAGASDWLSATLSEFLFETGDWDEAEAAIPEAARRHAGNMLLHRRLRSAELMLGRGDIEAAEAELQPAVRGARESTEPQFLAPLGAALAEVARRRGDTAAGRAAVDETLDRIEFCSDDLARIARVAEAGLAVEADAAQRARDRRDAAAEAEAVRRAEEMAERVRLAATDAGPVEAARLATATAELRRASGDDAPGLWDRAAETWEGLGRPYPAAYARWRAAEAHAASGDRAAAAKAADRALAAARELGSDWLADEVESLRARARLAVPDGGEPPSEPAEEPDDPFGLTERERQVLALVARGATNREIGSELHMAEKTASVHVSRILAKLDVRTRTEAAAVAHRHGLAA
jgi:DNA-binding CsgD family transcriptional regulator